jgi:hypothetical protein
MSQYLPVARCLLDPRRFALRHLFSRRKSFAPVRQPLAPAREVAYWHPACSEANECDPIATSARLRIPAHP